MYQNNLVLYYLRFDNYRKQYPFTMHMCKTTISSNAIKIRFTSLLEYNCVWSLILPVNVIFFCFLQAIEQPFLQAVSDTLGEKYSFNVSRIYKMAIHFILDTFVMGYRYSIRKDAKSKKNNANRVMDNNSIVGKSTVSLNRW